MPDHALALADGVERRFGDVVAVNGVSIDVRPGEVVGLIGANGAGKTTLVRLLLGLLAPSAGTVRLFGRPPARDTRAMLGYVPQGLGLYDDLTIRDNLAFHAAVFDVPLPPRRRGDGRLVGDTPLGLRRRAAFDAALLHQPQLLLLDEPTSGVDPLGRARLWDTIRDTADRGAGIVVTTHHLSEAERCDRIVVMVAGRAVATGTPEEIVGDRRSVRIRTRAGWEEPFDRLDQAGLPVALAGRELRVPGAVIEDVRARLDGLDVEVSNGPATLEETFVLLTEQG